MKVLLTGAAGFIGMHVAQRLLARGDEVVGLDNLNDYYEVSLKEARLARLTPQPGFRFVKMSVEDRDGMAQLFATERVDRVVGDSAEGVDGGNRVAQAAGEQPRRRREALRPSLQDGSALGQVGRRGAAAPPER